uniref:Uncharacterized protein n=1 Tax=Globodera rostochiensis TaxID=31243 RepID=A0A914I052_GLORO
MLYLAESLKCGVKHVVGGKFSQHTLDVVEGNQCVYAKCMEQSQAWHKFSDCKPDSVNCTHLTRECEEQGAKIAAAQQRMELRCQGRTPPRPQHQRQLPSRRQFRPKRRPILR